MPTRPSARDRLLRAARELFYADGYSVSIDTLTERAAVAKPTVYAHFKSKDALIGTMLDTASEQWFAELDAALAGRGDDPLARLLTPFDLLVAGLPDPTYHGCILINSAASFTDEAHPAHRALVEHEQRMRDRFEALAAEAGAARPIALARQLMVLYNGVKAHGLADHTGAVADDARSAARILLAAATETANVP